MKKQNDDAVSSNPVTTMTISELHFSQHLQHNEVLTRSDNADEYIVQCVYHFDTHDCVECSKTETETTVSISLAEVTTKNVCRHCQHVFELRSDSCFSSCLIFLFFHLLA